MAYGIRQGKGIRHLRSPGSRGGQRADRKETDRLDGSKHQERDQKQLPFGKLRFGSRKGPVAPISPASVTPSCGFLRGFPNGFPGVFSIVLLFPAGFL